MIKEGQTEGEGKINFIAHRLTARGGMERVKRERFMSINDKI